MTKERQVFDRTTVAHKWAHQTQSSARDTNNNFYFEGDTIYSYSGHFPIATLHKGKVLFTTRGYSKTTSKHINEVRSACSHIDKVYCYNPKDASRGYHDENIKQLEREASTISKSLERARKPIKDLEQIEALRKQLTEYCAHFDLKIDKVKKQHALTFIFIDSVEQYYKSSEDYAKAVEKQQKALAAKRKREAKKEANKLEIDLEHWRKFEILTSNGEVIEDVNMVSNSVKYADKSFLRFNTDTQRVETSKGVEIPAELAKRMYAWLNEQIKSGGCLDGGCEYKILHYQVNYVNATEFKVGCHTIDMSEAHAIAKQLNW